MPIIRNSRDGDIAAITALYDQHVLHGTGSFELTPPSEADMQARRNEVLARQLPYLVAESAGELVGFAYCNWFKPRPAYRYSAENSIYLAPGAQGHGTGRALLAELLARAEAAGVRKLLALIGDSANAASIGLHRALGFSDAGLLKSCGWKHGQWRDVVLMDKALGAGDNTPPE